MPSKLKKSFIYLALANLVFMASGYAIHIALGRSLGPAGYGIFAIIVSLFSLVELFMTSGLPGAVSKYIAEDASRARDILKKSFFIQAILTTAVTILYYLSAPIIAQLLNDSSLTGLIRLSCVIIPIYAFSSMYSAYYNGLSRYKIQALLQTAFSTVKVIAILALAYMFGISGAIIGYAVGPISIIILAYMLDKDKNSSSTFRSSALIRFAVPVTIFALAFNLFSSIDLLLIKSLLKDNAIAGIYNANLTIGRIPFYILTAIGAILLPEISKATNSNDMQRTRDLICGSLRYILIMLLPLTFILSATSEGIVRLLYSEKYIEAAAPSPYSCSA